LGARAAISTALPLSESWRKKGARALDWTTRVLTLLRRYAGGDPLRLALDDLQGAGETAELADVPELPAIPLIAQQEAGDLEVVLPELPRYIIRRMRMAHCKRGPELCEQCRQMNVEKISLLDISPPHPGEMQRRVIAVRHGGEQVWREFDIVRTFETEQEARQYATEHGIEDVEL
jgi:hypothetical protein